MKLCNCIAITKILCGTMRTALQILTPDDVDRDVGHATHTGVTRVLARVSDTCLVQQQVG